MEQKILDKPLSVEDMKKQMDDRYGMSSTQLRKQIGNYIYKNTILNPEACGFCEHISYDGCNAECSLQEPCPYRD